MTFDTFEQFHEYCQTNAHLIFVREQVDGKWGSYSLKELGDEKTLEWARRWGKENRMPVMIKEEMYEKSDN